MYTLKILLLLYLLLVNLFAFAVRGRDKRRALKEQWRVSEKHLLQLTAIGGGIGALAGMSFFRHKNMKGSFLWKFWLILAVQVFVLSYIFITF